MEKTKFLLGILTATNGALEAIEHAGEDPLSFVNRHQHGDWGDVCEEDKQENEFAVLNGERILSMYTLTTGVKICTITEANRSATTILLLEES